MKRNYTILAIDTSCDETSVAVTINDRVISNTIYSQVAIHKKWGGVVPMLAKREHEERIDQVVKEAFRQSNLNLKKTVFDQRQSLSEKSVDAIAVTIGPGLAPALEVGIVKAKQLAYEFNKPLIAVNHMEGHLLSPFAKNSKGNNRHAELISASSRFRIKTGDRTAPVKSGMTKKEVQEDNSPFPLIGLLISGGHTQLVLVNGIGNYKLIGETLDDAIGEAYDKVAKLLSLGYPGGPIIERLAKKGDEFAYDLPIPMKGRKDFNFSYSGLKTAVRYLVRDLVEKTGHTPSLQKQMVCDIAASFQRVASASLVNRLERAVTEYKPNGILLGGGVVSNLYVRNTIRNAMKDANVPVYVPYSKKLFTDNAAMIGVCAYFKAQRSEFVSDIDFINRKPNLNFNS